MTDLCSTPNLAMETTCFIPDLEKSSDMPNPAFKANITNKLLHWSNSPVLQSARPCAVALASHTVVDKIIKNTGFYMQRHLK